MNKRGAKCIETEADNFIVVFPNTSNAVLAAVEMREVLLKYKDSLS